MPCEDTTSRIVIDLDEKECLKEFRFAKITCSRDIGGRTGYSKYSAGKAVDEILCVDFMKAVTDLKVTHEEREFLLYLEWDALRMILMLYLGKEANIDHERYQVVSVDYHPQGVTIIGDILAPKNMPEVLACNIMPE